MTNADAETFSPAELAAVLFQTWRLPTDAVFKLALSGGLDSQTLLHALAQLRAAYPFKLHALHINHHLQPAADAWAQACAQSCQRYAVPFTQLDVAVNARGEGIEAAARNARYDALRAHIGAGEFLLTAHHADDCAETVLLNLLRGAGVHGLAAIPARAPFGEGELLRPLLRFTRAALHDFARAQALSWVEDPSNGDDRFSRNFIRAQVMPLLHKRWPHAQALLSRTARHARAAATLLDEMAAQDLHRCARDATLSIAALTALTPERQANVLRYWLRQRGFRAPSDTHLDEVRAVLLGSTARGTVRWPGTEVRRYRDALYAMAPLPPVPRELDMEWDMQAPLHLPQLALSLRAHATVGSGISRARLRGQVLRVKLRRGGETCRLARSGHTHDVRKLFQERGVPPWQRARMPFIYCAGAAGNDAESLVAVGDLWVCAAYAASEDEPGVALSCGAAPLASANVRT